MQSEQVGVRVVQDDELHPSAPTDRRCERGVAYIMASVRIDAPAAELILEALAQRTGRSAAAVAADLVHGRPFLGRPSWL